MELLFSRRVARELGGGVGEEGEVFDSRAWGNQILSPPAQRGEMSQRDRGGRPLPRGQHRAPLCLRHLPPPSRGERGSGRHLHPQSGGRGERGCSEDSWMSRSPSAGVRSAARVSAVGSLPLSRCATAPPRGERLDRAVWDGTAGWRTSARGLAGCVWRWLHRSVAAPLCLRHLPPLGGGRWDPGGRSPDSVGHSLWPTGARGEPVGRSPDSVGHSLWPTGARGEPVGRSPDSVGHSLWPTGGHVSLPTGEAISTWRR